MRVCKNGSVDPMFEMVIDADNDSVQQVKENIVKKLRQENHYQPGLSKSLRLFSSQGMEFLDYDNF